LTPTNGIVPLKNKKNSTNDGTPIWSSDTYGKKNTVCAVTNDGTMQVYEGTSVFKV